MTLLKQTLAILGAVFTITLLVAVISPRTAHAVAAALVQIEPGSATQVLQNETQLVNLYCTNSAPGCFPISPAGGFTTTPYVVPSGYTLIVTDWQFSYTKQSGQTGRTYTDVLSSTSNPSDVYAFGFAVADVAGNYAATEKFSTGIRVGSGVTITDGLALSNEGFAEIQGYLVPN
ncbi:MAG TPA: hypothetical protein VMD97_09780 [Candidatus Aquilonibacter sp.]|nr:hypothetical protein [Candidatus Aquilonibacter sp.]